MFDFVGKMEYNNNILNKKGEVYLGKPMSKAEEKRSERLCEVIEEEFSTKKQKEGGFRLKDRPHKRRNPRVSK